ncbi:hypothetical protein GYMLUDRAFT_309720 [Collybiopsis luxurians FD-317 M1]|nr:hypothetical protein GYMLUDRAFT_309720 [Collybiopsis luxurians FD-317 M1]
MAFIKRAFALALVAVAVVPFAAATSSKTSQTCSKTEFYYAKKDCCLPSGGPSNSHTPAPPSGKSCPVGNSKNTYWYWHSGKGCCVPSNPLPPSNPTPPQCQSGHDWQDSLQCCTPSTPSKPTPTPKPSGKPGYGSGSGNGNGNGYGSSNGNGYGSGSGNGHSNGHGGWKRSHTSRSLPACPKGLDACPISGLTSGDYECLDTSAELESCGGCASVGQGQDCTAIKGAWNVGCESGSCKVYSCAAGYLLSADSLSCIAI